MTVQTFYEVYDLTSMDVISIRNVKEGLSMVIDMDLTMHFDGGNHVRTEFDMTFCHEFLFMGCRADQDYLSDVRVTSQKYEDGVLILMVNGDLIRIPETEILIHRNYRPYVDHSIQ